MFNRIALFGDNVGIPRLLRNIPLQLVKIIVAAGLRPQYHNVLRGIAAEHDIAFLIQPRFSTPEYQIFARQVREFAIDLILCDSYSMLIRPDIIQSVSGNAINMHASLLPRNRGPNPFQWSIIRGESKTGVTIHYMDTGFDSGDIVAQQEICIEQTDTWPILSDKAQAVSERLWAENVQSIITGTAVRTPQNETEATRNQRLTPDTPRIDLASMSDMDVYNLIRAQVKPLQGAYIVHNGERIYFQEIVPLSEIPGLRQRYG